MISTGATLSIALTLAASVSALMWLDGVDQEVDSLQNRQTAMIIALAHRRQFDRCALPTGEVSLAAARASLSPRTFPQVENEADWRIRFIGDGNRRRSVSVYRLDGSGLVVDKRDHVLPMPGGEGAQGFLDAAFEDRTCP